MPVLTVGPNSTYPTIAAAMVAAGPTDTILLETGYSNETAMVTHNGMIVSGDATSTRIVLQLVPGIATFSLAGTAPINVLDAVDGNNIVGNDGNNVVTVTAGADAVAGGLGVDRLVVDYHLATGAITGDSTSNVAEAGGGGRLVTITNGTFENFTILTGSGADTITTGAGDDIINTGEGAGTVTAGQGANSIVGGSGADTITALDGGNFIDGGDGFNILTSGDGDDIILSGIGADTIVAGGGTDAVTVRGGADTSNGGAGNDRLIVDYSAFTTDVTGGVTGGNLGSGYTGHIADLTVNVVDFVATENFTITTGSGNDTITTGDGIDLLTGGLGNDNLDGGGGGDTMLGGAGNDTLHVDNTGDVVTEAVNEGTDTVISTIDYTLGVNVENLTLMASALSGTGTTEANVIIGNAAANTLVGLAGDDTLDGGAGADVMIGGAGNDIYFADSTNDGIAENAGEGTDIVMSTATFRLAPNVENLTLLGSADNLQAYGNADANTLTGNAGSNLLNGEAGADLMIGAAGNDTYFVDNASDRVVENLGEGSDAVFSTADFRLSANVETLLLQGGADLQGYGNDAANSIYGNTGNNLLDGDLGMDLMVGGAGNDTYFVDNANDAAFELAGEGNDVVLATANYGLAADVEVLVQQGNADLQGYGNATANTLYGNTGNNLLNGAGGADAVYGGLGNDTYFIDDALDLVFENAAEGNDAVFASVNYTLTANVEALVMDGGGNLSGTGNALANGVYGNSGNNTLDGGAGVDVLQGNAGNDTFVFNVGQGNGDTVVDFAGNAGAAGDSLLFVGFGGGATFTNIDATHWQVNYNAGASHDVITFMNAAPIDPTDYTFI